MNSTIRNDIVINRLFLAGIFIVLLIYIPNLIESALLGRYAALAFLLFLGFVYSIFRYPRTGLTISKVELLYILFIIWCFLSAIWSLSPSESIFESSKGFLGLLVFMVSAYWFRKKNGLLSLVKVVIVASLINLIFVLRELHSVGFDIFTREDLYSITGLNGHKNQLNVFLFLTLPFLVIGALLLKKGFRALAYFSFVMTFILILILQTRSVWIGLLTVSLFLLLMNFSHFKRFVFSIPRIWFILVLSGILLSLSYFLFRTSDMTFRSDTLVARSLVWKNSLHMFFDAPVLGVGNGNWKLRMAAYGLEGHLDQDISNGIIIFQRPHNDFLWILSETGLIGFGFYVLFIGMILINGIKYLKRTNLHTGSRIFSIIISFVLGFLVISFFTFPKERIEHLMLTNILLAYIYIQSKPESPFLLLRCTTSNIVKLLSVLMLIGVMTIGALKMKGEILLKKVIRANAAQDHEEVLRMANRAQSIFYTMDFVSLPIKWYEGYAYVSMGNLEDGLQAFQDAYDINPNSLLVLNNLGSIHELMGKRELAKMYYQRAIEISPAYDDARLNLAAVLYKEGDYERSLHWFNQVTDDEKKSRYSKMITDMLDQ